MSREQVAGVPFWEPVRAEEGRLLHFERTPGALQQGVLIRFGPDLPRALADIDALRRCLGARLGAVPAARRCLRRTPLTRLPFWVDAPRVALDYHVRHTAVPRPGTDAQLDALVGRLLSRPLDPSRPLWEVWLVEGLAGGDGAILLKVHPVADGGIGAFATARALCEALRSPDPSPPWIPRPQPAAAELLGWELGCLLRRPLGRMQPGAGTGERIAGAGAGRDAATGPHRRVATVTYPRPAGRGMRREALAAEVLAGLQAGLLEAAPPPVLGGSGRPLHCAVLSGGERAARLVRLPGPQRGARRRIAGRSSLRAALRAAEPCTTAGALDRADMLVVVLDRPVLPVVGGEVGAAFLAPLLPGHRLSAVACMQGGEVRLSLVADWDRLRNLDRIAAVLARVLQPRQPARTRSPARGRGAALPAGGG